MKFEDKNQSLVHPEGYDCVGVTALGAFLRVAYSKELVTSGAWPIRATNVIEVFLNDMGREVGRTCVQIIDSPPQVEAPARMLIARRFRIWNGFLIVLHGLREMLR